MNTPELYTLQRFYHEAKALLEKYNFTSDEKELRVDFSIEERNGVPNLKFWISYQNIKSSTMSGPVGWGQTPTNTLKEFEEQLQKATGRFLIERVAVEITE